MTVKYFCLVLLAVVVAAPTAAQNVDEFQIPVENDNHFPPDDHSDVIEGSGAGVIDEPAVSVMEVTETPTIEKFDTKMLLEDIGTTSLDNTNGCPRPCVCHIEGSTNDFVIDCSGYDLKEIPSPLNENATVLNIQNNKITEIPKHISSLTNLKVLNANDNLIMDLAPGSVSELPELVTLKLTNNRLIEYPNDLKNSFGLMKLETLDLGGNDMRTSLTADIFTKFMSLRTLVLPSSTEDLQQDLCKDLSMTLLEVCTGSCKNEIYECQEETSEEDLSYKLPGELPPPEYEYNNTEQFINTFNENVNDEEKTTAISNITMPQDIVTEASQNNVPSNEFSFRSAVNKQPSDTALLNAKLEVLNDVPSTTEAAAKVGATTSDTKTGGVDKSIIGLVVAGMIVVVAGITIKKNWTSIKKRFGSNSNSRTPNDRVDGNANGTTAEEVPLQDKSPV